MATGRAPRACYARAMRCHECKGEDLRATQATIARTVSGHALNATIDALRCEACGEITYALGDVGRGERIMAARLAELGERTGDAFRFMRKALRHTRAELGELLGESEATLREWEEGRVPIDLCPFVVLGRMVLDSIDAAGDGTTLALLLSVRDHAVPTRATTPAELGAAYYRHATEAMLDNPKG